MRIPDVNVLIYARNEQAAQHQRARQWMEDQLSGLESVGFATVALLGFVRLTTSARVFEHPLTPGEAADQISQWLSAPVASLVHPTASHFATLGDLLRGCGTAGNLTTDAHLAALAIEHQAMLTSFDGDFHRFPALAFEHLLR